MICILGESFAPDIFRKAARYHGILLTDDPMEADVVFISQDTPTDESGHRDLQPIREMVGNVQTNGTLVLTSQVPVGFTRSLGRPIYHQSETLRIRDAFTRAIYPEQFIVGCADRWEQLPRAYLEYMRVFKCPIEVMTFEEAEFCKIAINMTLISQVENTNKLHAYATQRHLKWEEVRRVLRQDKRIGAYAYLNPGSWKDSRHLLRDWVSFESS